MSILERHYLTPLRGRVAFGITTAVFTIYIYNNYNNLPSYQQLKSRFYERYFKPEPTNSQQESVTSTSENTISPDDTPMAVPRDNNKGNTKE